MKVASRVPLPGFMNNGTFMNGPQLGAHPVAIHSDSHLIRPDSSMILTRYGLRAGSFPLMPDSIKHSTQLPHRAIRSLDVMDQIVSGSLTQFGQLETSLHRKPIPISISACCGR